MPILIALGCLLGQIYAQGPDEALEETQIIRVVCSCVDSYEPNFPLDVNSWHADIQGAILEANAGDLIYVLPGTYYGVISFLGKSIQISGLAPGYEAEPLPIIDGNGLGPVVSFNHQEDANSVLEGVVVTGGNSEYSGGILCFKSSPVIRNCLVVGNQGSGISCQNSAAFIDNCTVSANLAASDSGGVSVSYSPNMRIHNSIIWFNAPLEIDLANGKKPIISYSNYRHASVGYGCIYADPIFVQQGFWRMVSTEWGEQPKWFHGDYHLQSLGNRWYAPLKVWTMDFQNSPSIDAGDPLTDPRQEPSIGLHRINMGAYGGTAQASTGPE